MKRYIPGTLAAFALGAGILGLACGRSQADPIAPAAYPLSNENANVYPAYLSQGGVYQGYGAPSPPSVSVSGEGKAAAPPDIAKVRVSINVRADTAARARDDGKAAISRLLSTLERFGVEGPDVETRSFSINPVTQRDEQTSEPQIVAYALRNTSEISLRDVERVGEMLDELVGEVGDVLRIDSISLAIEDPTGMRRQAREMAMRDAQAKAQQLADLAGVSLGPPLSISEGFEGTPSGLLSKEVLVAPVQEGVGPVTIGELEAAVSVYAVYTLVTQ
jgi:hypothetical protein